ncbi:Uncharacterised protein [Chryseobacterium nakagawai]|uniref:Uncharacterized protein n=1 Tax=Chryseobacterium nakagawai TaxID=1241982 RepID=A0AAD0YRL8_CHRNA|nr:hypothetical protein EG343_24205 [Chryseobacterium nakagawai]VEH20176.1 Uncharacterised protein [Chryseobacterium nakagawai]
MTLNVDFLKKKPNDKKETQINIKKFKVWLLVQKKREAIKASFFYDVWARIITNYFVFYTK